MFPNSIHKDSKLLEIMDLHGYARVHTGTEIARVPSDHSWSLQHGSKNTKGISMVCRNQGWRKINGDMSLSSSRDPFYIKRTIQNLEFGHKNPADLKIKVRAMRKKKLS